ncbi:hypothetical protein [Duganella aceris]|uniref:PLxRFG domain-containing protein n=1 Tax=Duganella aceris TaxID=2703883 RepID=A0ABX0FNE9_9BURK|nr:hypothetical protein [Duganella aceris]NGZ86017.1 hypothetical protein [Duganella aceris]
MPVQKLDLAYVTSMLKANTADFSALSREKAAEITTEIQARKFDDPTRLAEMSKIELPQTLEAWKAATDVDGLLTSSFFGTKTARARGPTLQIVDRAYDAWIKDITNGGNAANLQAALENYRGFAYKMTRNEAFSGVSTDHRSARNKNNVMDDVMAVATLMALLDKKFRNNDEDRRATREMMVTLMANIRVEWEWHKDALGGLALAPGIIDVIPGASDAIANGVIGVLKNGTGQIVTGSVAGAAAAGGIGYGAYTAATTTDAKAKLFKFLQEQCNNFANWIGTTLQRILGGDLRDIVAMAAKALKPVFTQVWKAASTFVGGAGDIVSGLTGLAKDAWTRHTITVQQTELVTSDGAFAILRSGIDRGIALRQAVSAWTMAKGAISTTLTVVSAGTVSKIADLLLAGFEFVFKMVYNALEDRRIQAFMLEARTMFQKVRTRGQHKGSAKPKAAAKGAPITEQEMPMVARGTMPAFAAAHYTGDQFMDDWRGTYLNFLYSMVKASPVMAAIVMNSGLIDERDVFHAATPRSDEDVARAAVHVFTLKEEAKRLFGECNFKITPANIADLQSGSTAASYQDLVRRAQSATQPNLIAA